MLDSDRLHMVVLDAALCLQDDKQSASVGPDLRRTARLHLAVRRISLRRGEFAVSALANYQPLTRLLLSVRATNPCCRIIYHQYSRLLLRLSSMGLPRACSTA